MTYRRARTPMGRQYQSRAIARAYATKWREADRRELPEFLRRVNDCAATPDGQILPHDIDTNVGRGEVWLRIPGRDYRATVREGVDVNAPITAEDVEVFEWRPA